MCSLGPPSWPFGAFSQHHASRLNLSGMSHNEDPGDCLWVLELLRFQSDSQKGLLGYRLPPYLPYPTREPQPMTGAREGRPGAPFLLQPRPPARLSSVASASPASSRVSGMGALSLEMPTALWVRRWKQLRVLHEHISSCRGVSSSLRGSWVQFLAQVPFYQVFLKCLL